METNTKENNYISSPKQDGYEVEIRYKYGIDIHGHMSLTACKEEYLTERESQYEAYSIAEDICGLSNDVYEWDWMDLEYQDCELEKRSIPDSHFLWTKDDEPADKEYLWTIQVGPDYETDRIPFSEYCDRMGLVPFDALTHLYPHDPDKVNDLVIEWEQRSGVSGNLFPTPSVQEVTKEPEWMEPTQRFVTDMYAAVNPNGRELEQYEVDRFCHNIYFAISTILGSPLSPNKGLKDIGISNGTTNLKVVSGLDELMEMAEVEDGVE